MISSRIYVNSHELSSDKIARMRIHLVTQRALIVYRKRNARGLTKSWTTRMAIYSPSKTHICANARGEDKSALVTRIPILLKKQNGTRPARNEIPPTTCCSSLADSEGYQSPKIRNMRRHPKCGCTGKASTDRRRVVDRGSPNVHELQDSHSLI